MEQKIPYENSENVSFLKRTKFFTLEKAREFLPKIEGITFVAIERATPLMEELKNPKGTKDKKEVTEELQEIVSLWSQQVMYFGALTRGLWMVDFDTGKGFYTWVFGEEDITSYREYHQAFEDRTPIKEDS